MDIKSTMARFGFGHRRANHIVIDHEGELWLALAPAAAGGFLPMGMTSLPGTLRAEPLENGEIQPFTYAATESKLELTTEKGAKVKFAIDADAQAIRIAGNTEFRLNGVETASFASTLNTPNGALISAGANRYLIAAKKGKIIFDDTWVLNQFHSVTPVVNITLEDGEFELCVFDYAADADVPAITKTLDECASENSDEFKTFIDSLVDIPAEWSDVKEKAAYPIWLCHRTTDDGKEIIVENKYSSKYCDSMLVSIASMAFKDASKAIDLILSLPVDMPPIAGIAAARLIDDDMLCDSRGDIYRVYAALEEAARNCAKKRAIFEDELCFYAYRFESGMKHSPEFFKVGEPILSPDLNAYLVIVCEVIAKLARMEYDVGIANKWEAHSKRYKANLIAELWDGENFIGKNAYTSETSEPDKFLSLAPLVLGARLPEDITRKLAAKIADAPVYNSVGLLYIAGLYDAGERTLAKELTIKALTDIRETGIKIPHYGASLLALAHKTLLPLRHCEERSDAAIQ